jgi:enoyl-CoA hydratase/carnithine racemase
VRARTLTEHDFGISKIALARVHVHAGGAEAKARDPSKPGSAPTATWRPLLSPADTSPDDDLLVDRSDPAIAVVTINRPKRRNAMKLAMWRELGRIFDELSGEPELRAVILTGAGGAFCAGADISEFGEVRATVEDGRAYEATGDHCQTAIASCSKATIAAISGPCFGGGVGLALSCDFRFADDTAYFGIPAARLSNVYGVVETRALYDAVGLAVAKEVLFTGRRYTAGEARDVGMVTHLAEDTALAAALSFADRLKLCAPLTIKGAKTVLDAIARNQTAEREAAIQAVADEAIASADYKEGVAAFAEKRDPRFRGV